ncbi:MAG: transposase [Clostridia bacterium]|nr:transposase [Clostridia bacterium]
MELPNRKSTRLKHYDYSKAGAYFITICTQNRLNLLSTIVGEGSPLPCLTDSGKIVDDLIHKIQTNYPEMSVDYYVIMPNHIHLLIRISRHINSTEHSEKLYAAMGWFKYMATKAINQIANTPGCKIFQRSFHDHIVRNEQDYYAIAQYIINNPTSWYLDCFYN